MSEDLGEYLRQALWDKENVEYARWLDGVGAFLSAK